MLFSPAVYTLLTTAVAKPPRNTGLMDTKLKVFNLGVVIVRSMVGGTGWTYMLQAILSNLTCM